MFQCTFIQVYGAHWASISRGRWLGSLGRFTAGLSILTSRIAKSILKTGTTLSDCITFQIQFAVMVLQERLDLVLHPLALVSRQQRT